MTRNQASVREQQWWRVVLTRRALLRLWWYEHGESLGLAPEYDLLTLVRTHAHVGEGVKSAPAKMMPGELHDSEAIFGSSVMWHAINPASRYPPGKACGPPLSLVVIYDAGPSTISKHSPPLTNRSYSNGHAAAPEPSKGSKVDKLSHYAQAHLNGKALDILCVRCTATATRDLQDW